MYVRLLGDPTPTGMWQKGLEEDCFWCGLPVVPVVWSLGRGGFPAALEAVALTVHFEDVDVMGDTVLNSIAPPLWFAWPSWLVVYLKPALP